MNHSHGRVNCSVPRTGVASARLTLKKPSPPEPRAAGGERALRRRLGADEHGGDEHEQHDRDEAGVDAGQDVRRFDGHDAPLSAVYER